MTALRRVADEVNESGLWADLVDPARDCIRRVVRGGHEPSHRVIYRCVDQRRVEAAKARAIPIEPLLPVDREEVRLLGEGHHNIGMLVQDGSEAGGSRSLGTDDESLRREWHRLFRR